jgi:hypothetical protein
MRKAFVLGVTLVALMFASPASAAPFVPISPQVDAEVTAAAAWCDSGDICLGQHINYGGAVFRTDRALSDLAPWGFNDKASSVCNATDTGIRLYVHKNYTGNSIRVQSGLCYRNLVTYGMNDSASSIKWDYP